MVIKGKVTAKTLTNSSELSIGKGLKADNFTNSGNTAIKGATAINDVTNSGTTKISGPVEVYSKLTNDKTFSVDGNFNAKEITNNADLLVNNSTFNAGKITTKDTGNINISSTTFNALGIVENQNISAVKSTINVSDPYYLVNDSLSMDSSTLNLGALSLKELHINNLNMNKSTINIPSTQVDFTTNTMGKLTFDKITPDKSSVINLNYLNNINVPTKETTFVKINFADTSFSHNVSYNGQDTIYAPIYRYGVSYDPKDGNMFFVRGGTYNPETGNIDRPANPADQFNPAILAPSVAAHTAATSTMNQTYSYVFQNSDNFMAYPLKQRMALIYKNRYALNELAPGLDSSLSSPLLPVNDESSTWFKPYANFETIQYKQGPKAHTTTYGSLVGFDTSIKSLKNGWARTYTGYIGYNGATQSFGGVHTTQNGGLLGGTLTFYKGNFFTALTATAGASLGTSRTMYGNEDFTALLGGIGTKSGYNFEFKGGKYILQPILFANYSFVNTFDYTNAAGVKIESDPLHTLQINPQVKFVANLKKGWQPYASVGVVWNVLNSSKVRANEVLLPKMTVDPYVEYGVGIQRN